MKVYPSRENSKKEVINLTNKQNGNGHRRFFNPVLVFLRLVLGQWEKQDRVSGEPYIVDSEKVREDLEDVADEPEEPGSNRNN